MKKKRNVVRMPKKPTPPVPEIKVAEKIPLNIIWQGSPKLTRRNHKA